MFVSNCAFLSVQAKNTHSPGDRHKVSRFMCHDTSTADRFYALNLDARQALEQRSLFESAVEGEDSPPGIPKRPATSSGPKLAQTRKLPSPAADNDSRESASVSPSFGGSV